MNLLYITIMLSLTAVVVGAGPKVIGNGGDAVVCSSSSHGATVEVLDYYEGRTFFDYEIKAPEGKNAQEITKNLIKRLQKRDAVLHDLLLEGLKNFNAESKYLPGIVLENITDSKHLYFPKSCRVEQIAVQRDSQMQEPVKFVISKDLWDQMDALNQAGLILHEVLYRQYIVNNISNQEVDSRIVRKFNAMIAADLLDSMPEKEFRKIASAFRPEINQHSIVGAVLTRQYESAGIPMTSQQVYTLDGELIHTLTCHFNKVGKGVDLKAKVQIAAKVEADYVIHEETKVERTYSADGKQFCVASLMKVKSSVRYLSDSEVMIGDAIWNIAAAKEETIPPPNVPSGNAQKIMKKWYNKLPHGTGTLEIVQDLTNAGTIKASVTCHFADGITKAYVEAPVTITDTKIINPEAKYDKVYSPSGRFFCMAVVAKRELDYKILSDDKISITGDEFIPDGTILTAID